MLLNWRSQKFWLGRRQKLDKMWRFSVTYWWWRHNYFLKFDFVIISLKNHNCWPNHGTSGHQYRRLRSFCKFVTKIVHLDMSQLKFSLKIWNNISIGRRLGLPGYALDVAYNTLTMAYRIQCWNIVILIQFIYIDDGVSNGRPNVGVLLHALSVILVKLNLSNKLNAIYSSNVIRKEFIML